MGKLLKGVQSTTEQAVQSVTAMKNVKSTIDSVARFSSVAQDMYALAGKTVLLSLSKAWLGVGLIKPARTEKISTDSTASKHAPTAAFSERAETPEIDRFDTSKMWSIRFGDYFMPLSQTYAVRASKKLNVSSLVDGIDIIQQTRKEAKSVDCTLKISVNTEHKNLNLASEDGKIKQLAEFLSELYEDDVVFNVDNETINDTLGIEWVIMSSFKFIPRAGQRTFTFEFSLTEVKFGDNVLTFDERQIQDPQEEANFFTLPDSVATGA